MSYYTSLSGLQNAQTDLSVIGNNIANADTNGFKKSSVDFSNLVAASAFTNPKNIVGIGSTVQSINQDFAQGGVKQTGSALDLMISGDGFFTTSSAVTGQVYYTRNGSFSMDGQGYLTDGSGNRLQVFPTDSSGNVTSTTPGSAQVPLTNAAGSQFSGATVAADGSISVSYADGSNSVIGKVALASFVAPQGLKQVGSSNYTSTGISGTATYGQPSTGQYGSLMSGSLEASNVDLSSEMVNLITAQQYFQANAKAIDANTTINDAIINLKS
ncbi:hypothetical protein Y88_1568 [Novosphingobium nitrogenifigens DSM 19370]|uniref:Flagellar hook protein FlgE n=1 Tax=Novosphingobium nitrogenifigens DSM 19370 TaxID=983920 RepID=F1Z7M2_9SPHN|nr:flagellar hook basal-body protein [Novosphingobium nitrogenifigens]EGD59413.1 hypothetical protein Y88_1568 [Novosphingobium nitrogenifigens DSM 19370]